MQVFTPKQVVCGVREDRRTLLWFHVDTGTRESAKLSIASATGEISCRRWLNSGVVERSTSDREFYGPLLTGGRGALGPVH